MAVYQLAEEIADKRKSQQAALSRADGA